jgi:hypothetical protein
MTDGFVLIFFTFSTTQEYYSMPCYPALALLIGAGIARRQICHARHDGHRRRRHAVLRGRGRNPDCRAGVAAPVTSPRL